MKDIPKLIKLSEETVNELQTKADLADRKLKPYMEGVLTRHAKAKSGGEIWDYLRKTLKKSRA